LKQIAESWEEWILSTSFEESFEVWLEIEEWGYISFDTATAVIDWIFDNLS